MGAALIWSTILGLLATVGLISLLLWALVRYPDRISHGPVPSYMRRAEVSALPKQRKAPEQAPEYGGAPTKTAA